MKKFLTIVTSLALVFAVCFSFVACGKGGKVDGKSYTAKDYRLTFVTYEKDELGNVKVDENDNKIIKSTEVLSLKDALVKAYRVSNEIAEETALTEKQQKEIDEYYDNCISEIYRVTDYVYNDAISGGMTKPFDEYKNTSYQRYTFKGEKVTFTEYNGKLSIKGSTYNCEESSSEYRTTDKYEVDGNVIKVTSSEEYGLVETHKTLLTNDAQTEIYETTYATFGVDFSDIFDTELVNVELAKVELVYFVDAK